jgi:glucose-1-phosphate cytidylyltransferase
VKVVILAGGYGTRLSEETDIRPKPMVEIGGMPILWHIMKIYSSQGFSDFIICTGYKGEMIRRYFLELHMHSSDFTIDTSTGKLFIHDSRSPSWRVTLIDTGLNTLTGGRLLRIRDYIEGNIFMMTYGDGLSNIDLNKLLSFHRGHGKLATLTAVKPPPRFGVLDLAPDGRVNSFHEKPVDDDTWINGGFFVLNKRVLDYIGDDEPYFEDYPLKNLARDGNLYAYKHNGFWRPMDSMSDKRILEAMWSSGKAEWKIWKD